MILNVIISIFPMPREILPLTLGYKAKVNLHSNDFCFISAYYGLNYTLII